jgi:class 3 adenylate cyclase
VGLGNKAIEFDTAVVLYADLDGSTTMVDTRIWQFSAEIYKTYLHCAAKIIKAQGGTLRPMTVTGSWRFLSATANAHVLCELHFSLTALL